MKDEKEAIFSSTQQFLLYFFPFGELNWFYIFFFSISSHPLFPLIIVSSSPHIFIALLSVYILEKEKLSVCARLGLIIRSSYIKWCHLIEESVKVAMLCVRKENQYLLKGSLLDEKEEKSN